MDKKNTSNQEFLSEEELNKKIATYIFTVGIIINSLGTIVAFVFRNKSIYFTLISLFYNIITFIIFSKIKKFDLYYKISLPATASIFLPGILLTSSKPEISILFDFIVPFLYADVLKKNFSFNFLIFFSGLELFFCILYKLDIFYAMIYVIIYIFEYYNMNLLLTSIKKAYDLIYVQNDKLNKIIKLDPLTNLYNRNGLEMVVSTVDEYYAIMLDIDFFKKVNDTYGHQIGDLLLKSLADILKKYADGRSVILARFGGEEFVLLSKLSYSETEYMCRHIILDVRTNLKTTHGEPITVSMGISQKGYYDGFDGSLIKDADKNLYLAKKNGRNTVFYSEKRMG